MEHKEFIRIVPGAECAVLFIHGIIGTPNHFLEFLPLVPADWSVYNILLDGHGKGVRDFSRTSMKKWKTQVADVLSCLKREHKKIIIAAHSMGTLFAIDSAVNDPERIRNLFLLASPLSLRPKPVVALTSLKVLFDTVRPEIPREIGAKNAYGIQPDRRLWRYLGWIPRYLELFTEISHTKKLIPQLKTPCTVFQSEQDELVSVSSVKALKVNPSITVYLLPESGHYHLALKEKKFVLKEFQNLCNSI